MSLIKKNGGPYIIAEMSGNHNQSLERALEIVDAAAKAGADAIKLQTYRADTITLDVDNEHFVVQGTQWDGRKLYELYEEAHTPWKWHKPIMERATELGIDCFSSPFDFEAVEFLESLNVRAYKIASFEITHIPLIEACAKTGKPLIISTGVAGKDDIELAIKTARNAGAKEIILLKCTSQYPAKAEDANLQTMLDIKDNFGVHVGLSDHVLENDVAKVAIAKGAVLVEKHFTLKRADGGVDSNFSLEPSELKELVEMAENKAQAIAEVEADERTSLIMGEVKYAGNEPNRRFSQQLWVAENVKEGDKLTADNVKIRRPNIGGLQPADYYNVLGAKFTKNLIKGTSLTNKLFS